MRAPILLALTLTAAGPALSAPKAPARRGAGQPKPAASPAKALPPDVISEGKEAVLVDALKPEGTTIVLFYSPDNPEQAELADVLKKRVDQDRRVALRWVRLKGVDAPIARQYEVKDLPVGFVYDRNKNLLGQGKNFTEIGMLVGKGVRTARLKWVDETDPQAAEAYRMFGGGQRPVPEIMKTFSLNPGVFELMAQLSRYHFSDGFLPRRTHELIASYVSSLNKCKY